MQLFSANPDIFSKEKLDQFLSIKTLKNGPQKLLIIGPDPCFPQSSPGHSPELIFHFMKSRDQTSVLLSVRSTVVRRHDSRKLDGLGLSVVKLQGLVSIYKRKLRPQAIIVLQKKILNFLCQNIYEFATNLKQNLNKKKLLQMYLFTNHITLQVHKVLSPNGPLEQASLQEYWKNIFYMRPILKSWFLEKIRFEI